VIVEQQRRIDLICLHFRSSISIVKQVLLYITSWENLLVSSLMNSINHPLCCYKCLVLFILIYIYTSYRAYQPSNIIRQTTAYTACLLVTSMFVHVFCFLSRNKRVNNAAILLSISQYIRMRTPHD